MINAPEYAVHVDTILQKLIEAENTGILDLDHNSVNKGKACTQLFITDTERSKVKLKIEFINDDAAHYGSISIDLFLGRIDSSRNILSNKSELTIKKRIPEVKNCVLIPFSLPQTETVDQDKP